MKKIVLGLFILMLLSGCSAEVNVDVLKDDSVLESVTISQDKSNISLNMDEKDIINNYLKVYEDSLVGYDYEDVSTDNFIRFKLTRKHDNICSYLKNSIFIKNGTTDLSCDINKDTYKVSAKVNSFECKEDCFEPPLIDDASLIINSNKITKDNNASKDNGNKYSWFFDDSSSNYVNFTLEKSKSIFSNNQSSSISIILVVGVLFALFILSYVLYKKYKRNKINL